MGAASTCSRCNFNHFGDCVSSEEELTIRSLEEELYLTRQEVIAQTQAKDDLQKEVARLKEGRFTEEEFQNLCHNFSPDKVCRFRQGCDYYQIKLFGEEAVQADIARQIRYALQQVVCYRTVDGLADSIAKTLVDSYRGA